VSVGDVGNVVRGEEKGREGGRREGREGSREGKGMYDRSVQRRALDRLENNS
jgi:hypothetical protein